MLCPGCPFFSGEVPADVCSRCSRARGTGALLRGASLLFLSWVAGHALTYFFVGSFWTWPLAAAASGGQLWAGPPLQLPGDYGFPVELSLFPAFAVVLGLLYGITAALPAVGASMLGLWVGVVMALASGTWALNPWYPAVLLAGALVAAPPGWVTRTERGWGGARWWPRRLALGVGVPTAYLVATHVVSAARTGLVLHLLPAGVAVATAAALVYVAYREVRWRSLRLFPVTLAALVLLVASPVLFSLTVTFPYLSYQLLWDRFSVEALCGPPVTTVAEFGRRRAQAVVRFADFAGRYPGNPLACEALMQEARLLNLRVTATAQGLGAPASPSSARNEKARGLSPLSSAAGAPVKSTGAPVEGLPVAGFSEDRIALEALPVYASIIKLAPASVAAARARLEQARWSLQNGRFEEARQRYRDVVVTYETHVAPDYVPPADLLLQGVCRWAGCPPGAGLGRGAPGTGRHFGPEETQVAYYEAYLTARQGLGFLAGNGQIEGEPLRLFLRLSPSADDYRQRLAELLLLYPEDVYPDLGLLGDVQVALARGLPDEAQRLSQLVSLRPRGEGSARALYRLAELHFRRGDTSSAEGCLRQLVQEAGAGGADPLRLEVVWAEALLRRGLGTPSSPGVQGGLGTEARAGHEEPSFAPWPEPFP